MATNQEKLDRIERGENVWHKQLPIGARKTVSAEMRLVGIDTITNELLRQNRQIIADLAAIKTTIAAGSNLTEAQIEGAVSKALGSYELGLIKKEEQ